MFRTGAGTAPTPINLAAAREGGDLPVRPVAAREPIVVIQGDGLNRSQSDEDGDGAPCYGVSTVTPGAGWRSCPDTPAAFANAE